MVSLCFSDQHRDQTAGSEDGGCLLTGEVSYVKAAPFKFSSTVTGPKFCPGAVQDAAGNGIGCCASVPQMGDHACPISDPKS